MIITKMQSVLNLLLIFGLKEISLVKSSTEKKDKLKSALKFVDFREIFPENKENSLNDELPWLAMSNLLSVVGNDKTVVIFINESAGMPYEILAELHDRTSRILLTDCNSNNSAMHLSQFLNEMHENCGDYCIFMIQCNLDVANHIINQSPKYEVLRPWILWIFLDPMALVLLNDTRLEWTGIEIGVPSCANSSEDFSNVETEKCFRYNVIDVYSRQKADIRLMATFSATSNYILNASEIEAKLNQDFQIVDLHNKTLLVAAHELKPILVIKNDTEKTKLKYEGVCIKILEQLALEMNFQYDLFPVADIGANQAFANKSYWTGIIGDIQAGKFDLAIGAISVTEDRIEAVDFTNPFLEDTSSILSNKPLQRSRILIFIKVFPWQVWLMLLIAILILGPVFTMLEGLIQTENKEKIIHMTIWESWWALVTSTIQKGELLPLGLPGRALATFWLLFLVVLIGTYSGMLLATMSFPGYLPTYETLRQFEDPKSPFPLILKPSATYNNLKGAHTPAATIIQERWKTDPNVVFPSNPDQVHGYLASGKYAFLSERLIFQQVIADQLQNYNSCPYYEAKVDFLRHYYSFLLQKNSPLTASMDIIFRRLSQSGIIQQWLLESLPKTAPCQEMESAADGLNAMNLTDIQGAFYTLALGLAASLMVLFGEICISRRNN